MPMSMLEPDSPWAAGTTLNWSGTGATLELDDTVLQEAFDVDEWSEIVNGAASYRTDSKTH